MMRNAVPLVVLVLIAGCSDSPKPADSPPVVPPAPVLFITHLDPHAFPPDVATSPSSLGAVIALALPGDAPMVAKVQTNAPNAMSCDVRLAWAEQACAGTCLSVDVVARDDARGDVEVHQRVELAPDVDRVVLSEGPSKDGSIHRVIFLPHGVKGLHPDDLPLLPPKT
jgi:hypothetical protein